MYAVAECTTLFALTALIGSLLLAVGVAFIAIQEGVVSVWRVSRKIAGGRLRRVATRKLVGPQGLAQTPMALFVAAKQRT